MTHNNTATRPVADLLDASKALKEQTMFAHRQVTSGAERAQRASSDLADLDMEKAFRQLREMVALVGGKRTATTDSATDTTTNVVPFSALSLAAE